MSRYLPAAEAQELCQPIKAHSLVSERVLGRSVEGVDISCYRLGRGQIKILAWSQMHGNESTSTRALLQFCNWLLAEAQKELLAQVSFYAIPQLNPDGANIHRRHNAAGVDLNRDALALKQPESRLLHQKFQDLQPDLGLNLHDQRTVHAAGVGGPPTTMSFLAPPADNENTSNPAQTTARQLIVLAAQKLESAGLGVVGRFQDDYNPNCFGEYFMSCGLPTVLLESGYYPGDYQRHQTKEAFFGALSAIVGGFAGQKYKDIDQGEYETIPHNQPEFVDLVVGGVELVVDGQDRGRQDLAVMFYEKLIDGRVEFIPLIVDWGQNLNRRAHQRLVWGRDGSLPYKTDISNHYNFIEDPELVGLIRQKVPSTLGG